MSVTNPPGAPAQAVLPSIRALLSRGLDHAGLFPPARLTLDRAVDEYLDRRDGPHRWLLGPFVVPMARLDELASLLRARGVTAPFPVAVLVPDDGPTGTMPAPLHVAQVELAAVQDPDAVGPTVERARAGLAAWTEVAAPGSEPAEVPIYVEVPVAGTEPDRIDALVRAVAGADASAKVRTGGPDASFVPTPGELAAFIEAAARHGVAWKATAGLHRPLPYDDPADRARHHGYLPVAAAGVLAASYGPLGVERLLADPSDLQVEADAIVWGGHRLDVPTIATARARSFRSFGSCSFDEPVEGLIELGLVGPGPVVG